VCVCEVENVCETDQRTNIVCVKSKNVCETGQRTDIVCVNRENLCVCVQIINVQSEHHSWELDVYHMTTPPSIRLAWIRPDKRSNAPGQHVGSFDTELIPRTWQILIATADNLIPSAVRKHCLWSVLRVKW
jgi:hypothetical protein